MSGSTNGTGFAVLDLETTGTGLWDRIVEVAIVVADPQGDVTGEWTTLVDPKRDVGPTEIHGIRARDLVEAPTFEDIAADLAALLTGRVLVAHNLAFDARMLRQEYQRLGHDNLPLSHHQGVCTMRLAPQYLTFAPRSLPDCCLAAGWEHKDKHQALGDAHAAARLLKHYVSQAQGDEDWLSLLDEAASWSWPTVHRPCNPRGIVTREHLARQRALSAGGKDPSHFLARIVPALPRVPDPPMADSYLALLDDALADRRIDSNEADTLVSFAQELGLSRSTVESLHRGYLKGLARAAWEDGILEQHEIDDLVEVAALLGLPTECVDQALHDRQPESAVPDLPQGNMRLQVGDKVCFTGAVPGRESLISQAAQTGLRVMGNVSRKTALLVCADATSQSGKARKARDAGVPLVTGQKFRRLLASLQAEESLT